MSPTQTSMNAHTHDQLRAIARAQRLLVVVIGINLLLSFGVGFLDAASNANVPNTIPPAVSISLAISILLLYVIQLVAVYRLASALGNLVAWVWMLGMLIPCVSLLLLLVLNQRASRALRQGGIQVGFFGTPSADVDRALESNTPPPAQ